MKYSLYGGEVELQFDERKHIYTVNDEVIPSVTGITGIIDKSGPLMWWAIGKALEHVKHMVKTHPDGMDEVDLNNMLYVAQREHLRSSSSAANIGTLAHDWIQQYLQGKDPAFPRNPILKGTVESFLKWHTEHPLGPIDTEFKVYSRQHKYAGTCDYDGHVGPERSAVDWKTGKRVYPEHRLQTAAYVGAREEELGIQYDSRWVVVLPKEGGEVIAERLGRETLERDFKGFLGALDLYRAVKEK